MVWPVKRIREDNNRYRSEFADLYMNFDSLLFFADAGTGDQFAFPVLLGKAAQRYSFGITRTTVGHGSREPSHHIDEWMTDAMTV